MPGLTFDPDPIKKRLQSKSLFYYPLIRYHLLDIRRFAVSHSRRFFHRFTHSGVRVNSG